MSTVNPLLPLLTTRPIPPPMMMIMMMIRVVVVVALVVAMMMKAKGAVGRPQEKVKELVQE